MKLLCFLVVASIFLAIGCSQDTAKSSNSGSSSPPASVDSHAHASEGLHHGTLIELGNEKYHAELVHDEQSVTIYILDRAATKAIPIDAAEVTIILSTMASLLNTSFLRARMRTIQLVNPRGTLSKMLN